jgi:hypothetical protein
MKRIELKTISAQRKLERVLNFERSLEQRGERSIHKFLGTVRKKTWRTMRLQFYREESDGIEEIVVADSGEARK